MEIQIKKVVHKGEQRIAIYLLYGHEKLSLIKAIDGRKWSRTLKCWHIAFSEENIEENIQILKRKNGISFIGRC